jgi:hypothetical protein
MITILYGRNVKKYRLRIIYIAILTRTKNNQRLPQVFVKREIGKSGKTDRYKGTKPLSAGSILAILLLYRLCLILHYAIL